MKSSITKSLILSLFLFLGVSIAAAQTTVTVGPTGMYPTPCAAFSHLADGDTVQVDANGGVPYHETACKITNNNLTIVGVNGRPILDATGLQTYYSIWRADGHDIVIDNFEFRNAQPIVENNAESIRVESGTVASPDGGNVTVQHSYIHDCGTGILSDVIAPGGNYAYYSPNPYITFLYDEFYHNGIGDGQTHNIYIGYAGNLTFNMQYSWSHDMNPGGEEGGHVLKDRAQYSNVYYNLFDDQLGFTDYLVDFGDGGSVYMVGNSLYKTAVTGGCCNQNFMIYRNAQDTDGYPEYTNEDFHFINNTVIDDPANSAPLQIISMECFNSASSDNCPLPGYGGPALTTPGVFENNIFLGPAGMPITNQSEALIENNIALTNNAANLASMKFNNPALLDYRLTPGSPAIGAGIYPPTNNNGIADPAALAKDEYVIPMNGKAWPTPSGSTMDAGAFYYAGAITPPSLNLSYSNSVTVPGTGTITVTGLPTPPAGQYNYAVFYSTNLAVIPEIEPAASSTGTVTTTFSSLPVATATVVPINIYVDGTVLTASVTVNPGPPTINSIALSNGKYYPSTTVTLNGPAAAGGTVVDLSSSNSTVWYAPASVTVPAGQISAPGGTLDGSFFTPSPTTATITGTTGSTQATLTAPVYVTSIHAFTCGSPCTVTGGQPITLNFTLAGLAPFGGTTVTFNSSNTAVIPTQYLNLTSGEANPPDDEVTLNTNSVTTSTVVDLTATMGGVTYTYQTPVITVTPGSPSNSIAVVSGSGQSAALGTNFPNPLVVSVTSSGNPVSGATVTFAGTGVSFPGGATAITGSNGQAQVTAEPTISGALTVAATVSGGSGPANFSETGTAGGTLTSITSDPYNLPGTTVHLAANATAPVVIQLSSSAPTTAYAPATVTVATGHSSAETGTLTGSLWTPPASAKSATITATYNGVTEQVVKNYYSPGIHSFGCSPCSVTGGQQAAFTFASLDSYTAPVGGGTVQITSNNTAVVPNQTVTIPQGTATPSPYPIEINTNAVGTATSVKVTATYNGSVDNSPLLTVNP